MHPFKKTCESFQDCPDRDPSHVIVNTHATAALGYYLKGDAGYAPYLEANYYRRHWQARVSYETSAE